MNPTTFSKWQVAWMRLTWWRYRWLTYCAVRKKDGCVFWLREELKCDD